MAITRLNLIRTLCKTPFKRLLPLLLGVLASLAVLLTWQQLTINGQIHIEQLIQQEANAIQSQLSKELSIRMLTLRRMAHRWEVNGGTPKELWEADAVAHLEDFYGCQAIEWVDRSFKVRWVVPLARNEAAQNLDLSRDPRRQIALQVARDLREMVLTHNILLAQGDKGFFVIVPLFVGDRFDGFIVGVFQFKTLFDSILKVSNGYNIAIYDRTESIYGQKLPSQPSLQKTAIVKAWRADWRVEVSPNPELITYLKSPWPVIVLIGGLVLAWLFALVVYMMQVNYRQISQLKKTTCQLQWEIDQRQQAELENGRLAAIVESSEDAIISKDLEGVITSWNLAAEKLFGYTATEIVGQSISKLIPAEYEYEKEQTLHKIKRGEYIKHYDTKRLKKDGTLVDVSISISPIKDENGKVIGTSRIARNIAERKQAEVALQESEARYRQLTDNLNAGFVIHAIDTSILLCNLTACKLLGLSMDQMLGKTASDPAWHFVREDGSVMPIEEYPVQRVLSTMIHIKNYVLGIYSGNHPLVWILVNAYPEFAPNGQLKQIVITFIDISKHKQAEEEIQQTRNFLQTMLDYLPVAVFVKDAHPENFGVLQFWNKTSEELFGISAKQIIGQSGYDFFPTEQAKFFEQKDREVFVKGCAEDIPQEVIDSHSLGKRWLHTVKIPIYDRQHQPQYLLCFSEDITDRKQAEGERREMSEVMENAVSGISKLDTRGRYLYVNKAYADITGYQPEQMIGMPWQNTVHPDELQKLVAAYWQMVQEGRVEVETTGVRKDGSVFYKQLVMIATYEEQHQLLGHYCFMKDISDRKQAEVALARELLRTKTFFNTSRDGVVVMNRRGKVVEASPSFARMLGYSLEETLNMNVSDWDVQWTQEELQIMIDREEIVPLFETRHRRKDGSVYDVEISWNRVELEGEMMNFCICRDISDRKRIEAERQQAEQALRESEARFQAFMNHSPAPAWITDENGVIFYASQTYLHTFELPTDDLIGKSIGELYSAAIAQQFLDNIQRVAQTQEVIETVEVAPRRDGTLGDFLVYNFLIPDLFGQMLVGGVAIDLTQQHQAETALQMSEERLMLALEASGDGLWDWNIKTGKVYLSSHYQEMRGYNPGELVMDLNVWEQMIHPDDKFWVFEYINSHLQDSSIKYAFDYRVRCKSGEWKWIADYGKVVAYDEQGKPLRMIGTHKDISDRKQKELALRQAMEAAESANMAKSIFLANMSHELRTPLNVILGFTQVMTHDPSLTPNQQEDLETIRRSGDHLLSLINDILDLSKIESGHCTIEQSGFDLIALLHNLRNMLAERASSKRLDLCFEIAPEVPQFILADAQKLRQVLLNLLSNAIKFTERGSITLRVSIKPPTTEVAFTTRTILQFAVRDTGVGIAPEEIDTIFDAFVQAQAGKQSVSGTGLGLTISRKLLELLGGEIAVSSILRQGTTFTFTLPITPTSGVNLTSEQHDRLVIGLAPGQPHHRILVVDDRPENRLLIVRLLTKLGLEVREATNGQEAIQLWLEWQPDLTWMDIRMPLLDGYEATKKIRAMEQGQTSIIIALTAQASQSDRTLALAAGCNDYISKPFRENTLFLKMAQYLGLEYVYQKEETVHEKQETYLSSTISPFSDSLAPTLMATLPEAWLAQLEEDAVCGDDGAIVELVSQLSPELAQLATRLTELANQYQFEQILQLIHGNSPT
ncbi:PAS domain S-box protein [Microcoleus sp. N3A4]